MTEPLPNEKRVSVRSIGRSRRVIDFEIDHDGDLLIEDEYGEDRLYVSSEDIPLLRDWLNKVLVP